MSLLLVVEVPSVVLGDSTVCELFAAAVVEATWDEEGVEVG